jgi:hypothetical protein
MITEKICHYLLGGVICGFISGLISHHWLASNDTQSFRNRHHSEQGKTPRASIQPIVMDPESASLLNRGIRQPKAIKRATTSTVEVLNQMIVDPIATIHRAAGLPYSEELAAYCAIVMQSLAERDLDAALDVATQYKSHLLGEVLWRAIGDANGGKARSEKRRIWNAATAPILKAALAETWRTADRAGTWALVTEPLAVEKPIDRDAITTIALVWRNYAKDDIPNAARLLAQLPTTAETLRVQTYAWDIFKRNPEKLAMARLEVEKWSNETAKAAALSRISTFELKVDSPK